MLLYFFIIRIYLFIIIVIYFCLTFPLFLTGTAKRAKGDDVPLPPALATPGAPPPHLFPLRPPQRAEGRPLGIFAPLVGNIGVYGPGHVVEMRTGRALAETGKQRPCVANGFAYWIH